MAKHELSALQQDFLRAFFQREDRFFLTGGAALVGFHLGHRETHDLDLFTLEDVMAEGMAAVTEVARELGWVLSQIELGHDLIPPGGVSAEELRRYLDELIDRLTRQAFPNS